MRAYLFVLTACLIFSAQESLAEGCFMGYPSPLQPQEEPAYGLNPPLRDHGNCTKKTEYRDLAQYNWLSQENGDPLSAKTSLRINNDGGEGGLRLDFIRGKLKF